ncbi:MAG: FeoA domain-containing protein [Crocinitomicaceae bacterium]|nr:FeoA domain-containing protein [Crocinitomicaceae bacterium]
MAQHLSKISNGETVIVRQIEESSLKVKLMEMGIVEGKELRVLYRAPLGDPIAIDVSGYVLSLRNDEANRVQVDLKPNLA